MKKAFYIVISLVIAAAGTAVAILSKDSGAAEAFAGGRAYGSSITALVGRLLGD